MVSYFSSKAPECQLKAICLFKVGVQCESVVCEKSER